MSDDAKPSTWRVTWIEVTVVAIILLVAIALIVPALRNAREAARMTQWRVNLKLVGMALHNYKDNYNVLPPGGTFTADGSPRHGWTTSLAPFVDASPFISMVDFNLPWDHPRQLEAFIDNGPPYFIDPSLEEHQSPDGLRLVHMSPNQWLMHRNSSVSWRSIEDQSRTLLMADAYGNFDPWGYPSNWRNPDVPLVTQKGEFGHVFRPVTHILFVDGHVGTVPTDQKSDVPLFLTGRPEIPVPDELVARPPYPYRLPAGGYWKTRTLWTFKELDPHGFADVILLKGRSPPGGEVEIVYLEEWGKDDYRGTLPLEESFMELGKHQGIRSLSLNRDVADRHIELLPDFPVLESLTLSGKELTDVGITQLARRYPTLTSLTIEFVSITDQGLSALASMPELRQLTIDKPEASILPHEAIKRFRERRPDVDLTVNLRMGHSMRTNLPPATTPDSK